MLSRRDLNKGCGFAAVSGSIRFIDVLAVTDGSAITLFFPPGLTPGN